MDPNDDLIAWCKEQRSHMEEQADLMEARKLITTEEAPGVVGVHDTTADNAAFLRRRIASLSALIDLHEERST